MAVGIGGNAKCDHATRQLASIMPRVGGPSPMIVEVSYHGILLARPESEMLLPYAGNWQMNPVPFSYVLLSNVVSIPHALAMDRIDSSSGILS